MVRRLPPLNQLRAFEAAARHLSFRAAADELHVTHSAISHQIKALEERFNTSLFSRVARNVTLSEEARLLAHRLTEALDHIDDAVRAFESRGLRGTLMISAVPWHANRILIPKLDAFHETFPDLRIEFEFSYVVASFENSNIDAAVRHGLGKWPELSSIRLHHDILSPVCSPSLVEGLPLPLPPEAISNMTLAAARGYEHVWLDWFQEADFEPVRELNLVLFENRALATEFAISGNGVTLSDFRVTADEINSGQLVRLHPVVLEAETGIHLVFPKNAHPDPRLEVVANWMRNCFEELRLAS